MGKEVLQFNIRDTRIGGGAPVTIQSMTNTDTRDAAATAEQILRLEEAGCQIVRFPFTTRIAPRRYRISGSIRIYRSLRISISITGLR